MKQLSMLDLWADPAPPPIPYVEPATRDVVTRAYGEDTYVMKIREDEPDPVYIEVRGTPCLIKFGFGWATYAVQEPGSLFWSGTGFRSFATSLDPETDLDRIAAVIERYIDAPKKDGNGCGGKLVRWWPSYIIQWQQSLAFTLEYGADRSKLWTQWGAEEHARIWAEKDAEFAAAVARMWAEGIDPNDVGPPARVSKKIRAAWPKFEQPQN